MNNIIKGLNEQNNRIIPILSYIQLEKSNRRIILTLIQFYESNQQF